MTTPSSSSTPPQSSPPDAIAARPTTDDACDWNAFWQAQGMPWRTGPEFSTERQAYLAERRAIEADIWQGVHPFYGVERKLMRVTNLHPLPLRCTEKIEYALYCTHHNAV